MAHIPIDLPDQMVHIHAQRELAFEVISSFGIGTGFNENAGSSKVESNDEIGNAVNGGRPNVVLEKDGQKMLVMFHTPLKFGWWSTSWSSEEWVTPQKPNSIDFELVPGTGVVAGGLRQLSDRFEFEEQGNCTLLIYKSRFGIRWSIGGWVLGKTLIGPIIKSHMIQHLGEVKETIESRARRSRMYPQRDCVESNEVRQVGGK